MKKTSGIKDPAAQAMGRKRWLNVSADSHRAIAQRALEVREAKRANKRAEAMARLPKRIAAALAQAERDGSGRAYYRFAYRLGLAQLSSATRKRQRDASERDLAKFGGLSETLKVLRAPLLERLPLDLTKLPHWWIIDHRASAAPFADPSFIALIPSTRHYVLGVGMRASTTGLAMDYGTKQHKLELVDADIARMRDLFEQAYQASESRPKAIAHDAYIDGLLRKNGLR
jgi:hypothetical protein